MNAGTPVGVLLREQLDDCILLEIEVRLYLQRILHRQPIRLLVTLRP